MYNLYVFGTDSDGHRNIVASDTEIAFEGAMVVTPAGATLVKDLTLRVPAGTNLLVTGPNGSGAVAFAKVVCSDHSRRRTAHAQIVHVRRSS